MQRTRRPKSTATTYKLEIAGLVDNKKPWTLEELYELPQETQITRHICVEGWSAIGSWTGARLSRLSASASAPISRAKYVYFICAEGYSNTIDMPTALHPQTQMTFRFDDEILPRKYGFPMKIRIPTKLGFKNPKHVVAMAVTNDDPAAIGRTRATTGSAGADRPRSRWKAAKSAATARNATEDRKPIDRSPVASAIAPLGSARSPDQVRTPPSLRRHRSATRLGG